MRNSIVKTEVIADGMSAMERNVKRVGGLSVSNHQLTARFASHASEYI